MFKYFKLFSGKIQINSKYFSSTLIALFFLFTIFITLRTHIHYKDYFPKIENSYKSISKFIKDNTLYDHIIFSPHINIATRDISYPTENIHILALTMKNIYQFNSIFDLYEQLISLKEIKNNYYADIFLLNNYSIGKYKNLFTLINDLDPRVKNDEKYTLYTINRRQLQKLLPKIKRLSTKIMEQAIIDKDIFTLTNYFQSTLGKNNYHFKEEYDKIVNSIKGRPISNKADLIDFNIAKVAYSEYKINLLFRVKENFIKKWVIYIHGYVNKSKKNNLSSHRIQYGFENWDFLPYPLTSMWEKGSYIILSTKVKVELIPYDIKIGFYRNADGNLGNEINLGTINFKKIKQ
ncbi:hypothetical protein J7L48_09120, partial [bacterium]|nr:hypothetical protein [bacterium]